MAFPSFPVVSEITSGHAYPGRNVLFDRVDAFRFVGNGAGHLLIRSLPLRSVTVATVSSSGHDIALHEASKASFLMPLGGTLSIGTEGRSFTAGADGALFLRPGYRETAVRPATQERFRAALVLAPRGGRAGAAEPVGRAFRSAATDAAASALCGYLRYLLEEAARPDSPLLRGAPLAASEALLRDLMAELDGADTAPGPTELDLAARRVRLAEEFIRAHADGALSIEQVAERVGVGMRALQLAFRASRGVSPRAVLHEARLERARARLLAPDGSASVSDIALASGFAHFGRFAAAYRARFGEPPSETLRRARR